MNKTQIIKQLQLLFSKNEVEATEATEVVAEVVEKFEDVVGADGRTYQTDGDLAAGILLSVVGEDGTITPTEAGEYELQDGRIIVVGEDSLIVEIKETEAPAEAPAEAEPEMNIATDEALPASPAVVEEGGEAPISEQEKETPEAVEPTETEARIDALEELIRGLSTQITDLLETNQAFGKVLEAYGEKTTDLNIDTKTSFSAKEKKISDQETKLLAIANHRNRNKK